MTGVYLFKTTRTTGLLVISFVWVTSHRTVGKGLRFHVLCLDYWCGIWKMVAIVELRWFWHRIGQYSLPLMWRFIKIYIKGLHSRTSLWNLVVLENALTSHNPTIWFLLYYRKNFVNTLTWVCVSFPRNDVGKNPIILQLVTLKPTLPKGKNSLPLHLDNLVLCWFWKYGRTLITWTRITWILCYMCNFN